MWPVNVLTFPCNFLVAIRNYVCGIKHVFIIIIILSSRTSPNTQPIQTVSNVRGLGLLLNTGFSVDGSVARVTKKGYGILFTLTPIISSPCTKRLFGRILNMHYRHRNSQALESVQKLAVKTVNEAALQQPRIFPLVRRRIRGDYNLYV